MMHVSYIYSNNIVDPEKVSLHCNNLAEDTEFIEHD
jgi:hypothetical protein